MNRVLLDMACFVIIVAGLKAASSLVVPFLLALFLAIILSPPFLAMQRRGQAGITAADDADVGAPRALQRRQLDRIVVRGLIIGRGIVGTVAAVLYQLKRHEAGSGDHFVGQVEALPGTLDEDVYVGFLQN